MSHLGCPSLKRCNLHKCFGPLECSVALQVFGLLFFFGSYLVFCVLNVINTMSRGVNPEPNTCKTSLFTSWLRKLFDSGFKVKPLMLERNLKVAIQEFEDDDAVCYKHFLPCKNLGYQIVASEVDEKLFSSENVVHGLPTFDAMLGAYVFAHM